MTQITVPQPAQSCWPPSFGLAQAAGRSQLAAQQQVAAFERRRLARELHDGAIQEVLAAGLAIDLCLAELPEGSPMRAGLEDARRLTASALRRLRSSLQSLRTAADIADEDLPDMLRRLRGRRPTHQLEVALH